MLRASTDTETLTRQLKVLHLSLAESERSWAAMGFTAVRNPVAESIRVDIQRIQALLVDPLEVTPPAIVIGDQLA